MSDEIPESADAPLPFVAIRAMFDTLGVTTFGAALPEGRIQWMNRDNEVVATAACRVVLSWAAGNDSILWGTHLPGFAEAGIPVVALPEGQEPSQEGVSKEEAESIATAACMGSAMQFIYEAPTGGGCLFLAVDGFRPGSEDESPEAASDRLKRAQQWAARTLAGIADALEARDDGAIGSMGAFAKDLRNQADLALVGLPASATVRELAEAVEALQPEAETDPAQVAAALRSRVSEVGRWGATVGDA